MAILRQPVSLRALTGMVVLVMGMLGMSLALVTGEIYHRLTLENQRLGLSNLVGLATTEILTELEEKARALGLSVQTGPGFDHALAAHDYTAIERLLNDQFHQYFVTAGEIRLIQLRLFNADFKLLAAASEGTRAFPAGQAACPGLLERAAARQGPERLQLISALCDETTPLYSLIVPIGGLWVRGYVEVIADPSYSLESLEHALGMPLRLHTVSGTKLYQSASWPDQDSMDAVLAVEYPVQGDAGVVMRATLLSDVAALQAKLDETLHAILLVATVVTLLVAGAVFWVLRRTALEPIAQLLRQLDSYRQEGGGGAIKLGNSRIPAVKELHALQDLYRTLDHLAYTDPLTLLPNRVQFRECLERNTVNDRRQQAGFALLMMDLDGFKKINDRFGHQAGDELLHQVARRLAGVMRHGDVISLLGEVSGMPAQDDLVARLGGDEFGILLPALTRQSDVMAVVDKLLRALREPFQIGEQDCSVGLSIGAAFYPTDASDLETLIGLADAAMYTAKRSGLGCVFAGSAEVSVVATASPPPTLAQKS